MGQVAQLGRSPEQNPSIFGVVPSHETFLQTVSMSFSLRPQWGLNCQSLAWGLVFSRRLRPPHQQGIPMTLYLSIH